MAALIPFPRRAPQPMVPNNLPVSDTLCIGRDQELARLDALSAEQRMITLLGAGGIGKTRLALEWAVRQLGRFTDGVWLVELAALHDAAQIAETIGTLLSLKLGGDRTASDALPSLLRHKQLLLVLDNCEHLVAPAARLAHGLLRACPNIAILATSRSPLRVHGEQCVALDGLDVPEATPPTVAEALAAPAVRLFVDRARLVAPDFTLDAATMPAVAAICRRLDGMALAIELAASRLRMLSPHELLAGLDNRFGLLTGGARTGLPRQQTLRALIDWSHDLLSAEEAVAFARLGAFGGSFTLIAARETISSDLLHPDSVLELMAELLDKSLLTARASATGPTRYRLSETMRQYALEKLNGDPDRAGVMARFCGWLIRHYGEAEAVWATTRADLWLARHAPDLDNLRAGLVWAFGPEGDAALGLALISTTSPLWRDLGLAVEQHHWLRAAEPRIDAAAPLRVAARIGLDLAFAAGGGAFGDKRRLGAALQALERYRTLGDPETIALAAARVSVCLASPDDMSAAAPYVDLIEAALPALGPTRHRAWLLNVLGTLVHFVGDAARATRLLDESIAISRTWHDAVNLQMAGLNLAEIKFAGGDAAGALLEAEAVAASCRASGNLLDLCFTLNNLACYALVKGDVARACPILAEVVPLVADIGVELVLIGALQAAGLFAIRCGEAETAARLYGFTENFYATNAIAREATEQAIHGALVTSLDQSERTGSLAPSRRRDLISEGCRWTQGEAVAASLLMLERVGLRTAPA